MIEKFVDEQAQRIMRIVRRNIDEYTGENWVTVEGWSLPQIRLALYEAYNRGVADARSKEDSTGVS